MHIKEESLCVIHFLRSSLRTNFFTVEIFLHDLDSDAFGLVLGETFGFGSQTHVCSLDCRPEGFVLAIKMLQLFVNSLICATAVTDNMSNTEASRTNTMVCLPLEKSHELLPLFCKACMPILWMAFKLGFIIFEELLQFRIHGIFIHQVSGLLLLNLFGESDNRMVLLVNLRFQIFLHPTLTFGELPEKV